ncbi:MAG: peptide deformylase, partial [Candidatus Zambryskibacteria bacterium]|nr:peptide deformylase [Candidatus Zambryskibacteria bacterium]
MTSSQQLTTNTKKKGSIVSRDAAVLRAVAKPVDPKDIGAKKIGNILNKMKEAVHTEDDGVAIAAPQIGESLRIFVVKGEALALAKQSKSIKVNMELKDLVFINPEIIKTSRKKKKMEEGCLSVRWLYGEVERFEKVTISAYDEFGNKSVLGASGLMAQIFQHEIDHLDG